MIGWVYDRIVGLVVEPQASSAGSVTVAGREWSLATVRDPDSAPLNANAQELDLIGLGTAPISGTEEIGGGVELRHTITVGLSVEHGDPVAARMIRDAIVTELVLRYRASESAIRQTRDPATGQYVSRLGWSVDYRPLAVDTPNEYASVTFTVDATLDG